MRRLATLKTHRIATTQALAKALNTGDGAPETKADRIARAGERGKIKSQVKKKSKKFKSTQAPLPTGTASQIFSFLDSRQRKN